MATDNPIVKAQKDSEKIQSAMVRPTSYGGVAEQAFSYDAATRKYASWVFKALQINAKARGSVPLRLYIRRPSNAFRALWNTRPVDRKRLAFLNGDGALRPSSHVLRKAADFADDFEEVTEEHPILALLSKPNPAQTGTAFVEMQHLHYQLTGNSYLHPVISGGRVVQLWPMLSHWTWIVPGEPGESFVEGYQYGNPWRMERIPFDADEVLHWKDANPFDLYYGYGKIAPAWSVIQRNEADHEYQLGLRRNFARPDWTLILKQGASEDEMRNLQSQIQNQFSGTRDAGQFLVLTGDVDLKPLQFAPAELGDGQGVLEELAAILEVPVTKLQANDPNRANAEQGDHDWTKDATQPALRAHEEYLNEKLLPLFGEEVAENAYLAYDNPLPEDREFLHRTRIENVNAGLKTLNEAREETGDEPYDADIGDVPRFNGVAADDVAGQFGSPFGGGFSLGPNGLVLGERTNPVSAGIADRVSGRAGGNGVQTRSQAELRHKAAAEDAERDEPDSVIRDLQAEIQAILDRQLEAVLSVLTGRKSLHRKTPLSDIIGAIMGESLNVEQSLAEALLPSIEVGATAGLAKINGAFDPFDVRNPAVVQFIDGYTPRLAGAIQQQTLSALSAAHARWQAGDGAIADLITEVRALDSAFGPARAEAIARTESARAFVEGEVQGWEQTGEVIGKRWLLAPNACEFCKQAAKIYNGSEQPIGLRDVPQQLGQGKVLVGTEGGRMALDYEGIAGPPLHPNDRCDLVPVLK